jgi:hypothetical protein
MSATSTCQEEDVASIGVCFLPRRRRVSLHRNEGAGKYSDEIPKKYDEIWAAT